MASIKILSGLLILYLLQFTFAKPVADASKFLDSSEDLNISAKDALMLYTGLRFLLIASKYLGESVNISHAILQDEVLLSNDQPEVIEFKNTIRGFLETFDSIENIEEEADEEDFYVIEIFANTTDHYFNLSPELQTPESDFIVEILTKHKVKEMESNIIKEFEEFIVNFKILFEKAREELSKPLLDWYDKFETISDVEEKFEVFNEFGELMKDEIPL
ncbi:uncharacterized protein ACRADG_005238 [Cochliomyia hominivorax]